MVGCCKPCVIYTLLGIFPAHKNFPRNRITSRMILFFNQSYCIFISAPKQIYNINIFHTISPEYVFLYRLRKYHNKKGSHNKYRISYALVTRFLQVSASHTYLHPTSYFYKKQANCMFPKQSKLKKLNIKPLILRKYFWYRLPQ